MGLKDDIHHATGVADLAIKHRDEAEAKLAQIRSWCSAYPLAVFPEPDFAKAKELLEAGGMTLDAISASNMRHVLQGVLRIIGEEETEW